MCIAIWTFFNSKSNSNRPTSMVTGDMEMQLAVSKLSFSNKIVRKNEPYEAISHLPTEEMKLISSTLIS